MSLTKIVNGERVDCSAEEEQAIRDQWAEPRPLDEVRAEKSDEIKEYALGLIQSRIPAIDSYEMVAFMRVLWPTLVDPESQVDLAYVRDVYVHTMTRLEQLETTDRATIEGYDPATDTGWP